MKTLCLVILAVLFATSALADHLHPESWYQESWCAAVGGEEEHVLPDGTRVDCLTEAMAVEFDFAPKWAEAIGQSLYYAAMTGRAPVIVLIMEEPGDYRYMVRLTNTLTASSLGIRVFAVAP